VSVYHYTTQPTTLVTENWDEYEGLVVRDIRRSCGSFAVVKVDVKGHSG
jgi:hypothetical protein